MKKNFNITLLGILFLALCIFTSCQKDEEMVSPPAPSPDYEGLVFTGYLGNPLTKTDIDIQGSVGKVYWLAGDEITINGVVYVAAINGEKSQSATFTKKNESDPDAQLVNGKYVATYGNITTQVYNATANHDGSNCPLLAESTSTTLQFSNPYGVVKLNIQATGKSVKNINVGGYQLDCGAGVSINSATDFYIALPAAPGSLNPKSGGTSYPKLKIVITDTNNQVCIKTANNSIDLYANTITPVTLSTGLTFADPPSPTPVTTYYKLVEGVVTVVENPVEGSNTEFDYNGNNFKIAFSPENGNAINWDNGDILEAKVTTKGGQRLWVMGDDDDSSDDGVIYTHSNNSNWWKVVARSTKTTGEQNGELNLMNTDAIENVSTVNMMYLSKATGLKWSFNGDVWYTVPTVKNDVDHLSPLLSRGSTNNKPFYFGNYTNYGDVTYGYIKVTRSGSYLPSTPVPVTGISLDQTDIELINGHNQSLAATVSPAGATMNTVIWSSGNTGLATVSSDGVVTAAASGTGNVVITAKTVDGGFTATCTVTVVEAPAYSGVTYFDKEGQTYTFQPDGWDVGGSFGAFVVSDQTGENKINWAAGDYVEMEFLPGNGGVGLIFGNNASVTGDPNTGSSCCVFAWPSYNNPQLYIGNNATNTKILDKAFTPPLALTLRISNAKVEYCTDHDGNWTDITSGKTLDFQDPANLSDGKLYMKAKNGNTGHYNYIKVVKAPIN